MSSLADALRGVGAFGLPAVEGLTLGPYTVERQLGRGAAGVVFLARDARRQGPVALKVLLPQGGADDVKRKRMLREATLPADIDHPGIVPILDSGTIDGFPYLALEFVEGETLGAELKRGLFAPDRARALALDLADALGAAHAAGIVHRDLKPANILIRASDGRALISDFGVARNVDLASSLTKTGALVGTPAYAAPEQTVGETPVPSWDVFALGVILYEGLTGVLPFEARTATERLTRILERDVTAPRELNPAVPADLERVLLKALAPASALRQANGSVFATELRTGDGQEPATGVVAIRTLGGLAAGVAAVTVAILLLGRDPPPAAGPAPAPPAGKPEPLGVRPFQWFRADTKTRPPGRDGFQRTLVYDGSRQQILFMGGANTDRTSKTKTYFNDLWSWNGSDWSLLEPEGKAPLARSEHAAAYDPLRDVVVLFGGTRHKERRFLGDLWEWNGKSWTQRTMKKGPRARLGHVMVYDPQRKAVVVFGGELPKQGLTNQLWSWDGEDWTRIRTGEPGPRGRMLSAMAYDPLAGTLVLYGGIGRQGFDADLWELAGDTWRKIEPRDPRPAPVFNAALFHDGRRLILTGGVYRWGDVGTATWAWDGERWTQLRGQVTPERFHAGAIWDPARNEAVLFGGLLYPETTPSSETWRFREARRGEPLAETVGLGWTQRHPEPAPPARQGAIGALVYDPKRERLLLFSGQAGSGARDFLDDLWAWDGETWSTVETEGAAPAPRIGHTLAYDSHRDRVILYGGVGPVAGYSRSRDLWEFDGDAWHDRTPSSASPPDTRWHGLVYDPKSRVTWLFAGELDDDTLGNGLWSWDGARWAHVVHTTPWPLERKRQAMSYDSVRSELVVYGGLGDQGRVLSDLWAWNGTAWRELLPRGDVRPPPLHGARLLDTGKVLLLVGGSTGERGRHESVWSWDGEAWTLLETDRLTWPRRWPAVGIDRKRQTVVVFGGTRTGAKAKAKGPLGDTWELPYAR